MQGSRLAEMVRSGQIVNPPAFLGVPILDVHARPVSVRWSSGTDRRARPDVSGCLLYLGRDGSDVLIYQVRRARNLRVPAMTAFRRSLDVACCESRGTMRWWSSAATVSAWLLTSFPVAAGWAAPVKVMRPTSRAAAAASRVTRRPDARLRNRSGARRLAPAPAPERVLPLIGDRAQQETAVDDRRL
jgi:hypothetical protein